MRYKLSIKHRTQPIRINVDLYADSHARAIHLAVEYCCCARELVGLDYEALLSTTDGEVWERTRQSIHFMILKGRDRDPDGK